MADQGLQDIQFTPSGDEVETNMASKVLAPNIKSLRIGSIEDLADDEPSKPSKQVM